MIFDVFLLTNLSFTEAYLMLRTVSQVSGATFHSKIRLVDF